MRFYLCYVYRFSYVFALLLTACDGSPQAAPAATIAAAPLPAGWQSTNLPQLSLALPQQWTVTSADDIDVTGAVAEMAAQNPQLKAALDQGNAALASGQVQLLAYDLDPKNLDQSGFPTNLRVGHQAFSEPPTQAQIADVNEQDLRKAPGFSNVQRAAIKIGDLDATRLLSQLNINDAAGQPLTLALEQYFLVNGKDVYVLSFTTPAARQSAYRTTFDQILATLRLKQ